MDLHDAWRQQYRIELETPRLLLRPLAAADVEWLIQLFTDPDVNRFLWEEASSLDKAKRTAEAIVYLDQMRFRFGHWAIQDKVTGVVHGWTELSKLRPWVGPSDEIAISYVLRKESWGQGIATEAASRLLRHGFEILGLETVLAVIKVDNAASRRVLEKMGMRPVQNEELAEWKHLQYFQIDAPGKVG